MREKEKEFFIVLFFFLAAIVRERKSEVVRRKNELKRVVLILNFSFFTKLGVFIFFSLLKELLFLKERECDSFLSRKARLLCIISCLKRRNKKNTCNRQTDR